MNNIGTSFLVVVWFGSSPAPHSPPSSVSNFLSFSVSLCVAGPAYWREGRGRAWSRFIRPQESLCFNISVNPLCPNLSQYLQFKRTLIYNKELCFNTIFIFIQNYVPFTRQFLHKYVLKLRHSLKNSYAQVKLVLRPGQAACGGLRIRQAWLWVGLRDWFRVPQLGVSCWAWPASWSCCAQAWSPSAPGSPPPTPHTSTCSVIYLTVCGYRTCVSPGILLW